MKDNKLFALKCAVEEATIGLDELPTLIQLVIESFNLDKKNPTRDERMDVALNMNAIYTVLSIVQRTIIETNSKLEDIISDNTTDQQKTEA